VTAFFIPGVSGDLRFIEDAYRAMRRQIELDMGRCPSSRRILSVWSRRGAMDCVTEVGRRDPLHGATVMAIFDMGRHQPFVVWCQQDAEARNDAARDVIGPEAYSVLEFDT
jgi:hypothetical protein